MSSHGDGDDSACGRENINWNDGDNVNCCFGGRGNSNDEQLPRKMQLAGTITQNTSIVKLALKIPNTFMIDDGANNFTRP